MPLNPTSDTLLEIVSVARGPPLDLLDPAMTPSK